VTLAKLIKNINFTKTTTNIKNHMIKLLINGQTYEYDGAPEMPILWALRDVMGLTGTKYACGKGLCGSCTILLNGDPVKSCVAPMSVADGKEIITIEGLANENNYLQQAWEEFNVPQCGFCQPGQLIASLALLNNNADPSDDDIQTALNGNICRCGTYTRIKKAIHRAAELKRQHRSELSKS